jgi:BRICHOS domain
MAAYKELTKTTNAFKRRNYIFCGCALMSILLISGTFTGIYIANRQKDDPIGICGVLPPTDDRLTNLEAIIKNSKSTNMATVHDFGTNLSAVIDRDERKCFVLPLNKTQIKSPKNHDDFMEKIKAGQYKVSSDRNYTVTKLNDTGKLGTSIRTECTGYSIYMLTETDKLGDDLSCFRNITCSTPKGCAITLNLPN